MNKGANGTGDVIVIRFEDGSDPTERRALEAARLLATRHGRRRQVIVALLEAVYAHYEATGEVMTASTISAALAGQGGIVEQQSVNFTNTVTQMHVSPTPKARRKQVSQRNVEIKATTSSASTVAANFLSSMKSLTGGFFD